MRGAGGEAWWRFPLPLLQPASLANALTANLPPDGRPASGETTFCAVCDALALDATPPLPQMSSLPPPASTTCPASPSMRARCTLCLSSRRRRWVGGCTGVSGEGGCQAQEGRSRRDLPRPAAAAVSRLGLFAVVCVQPAGPRQHTDELLRFRCSSCPSLPQIFAENEASLRAIRASFRTV